MASQKTPEKPKLPKTSQDWRTHLEGADRNSYHSDRASGLDTGDVTRRTYLTKICDTCGTQWLMFAIIGPSGDPIATPSIWS